MSSSVASAPRAPSVNPAMATASPLTGNNNPDDSETHYDNRNVNGTSEENAVPRSRPKPSTLTSLSDILSALSQLEAEESALSSELSALLTSRQPIVDALARVQTLSAPLESLGKDAGALAAKVAITAQTAERVGGRVRSLDEEMRRVREAGDRVGMVVELKSSLAALRAAIEAQDWESATRHCARAMALPRDVVGGEFAALMIPTTDAPLPPLQALEEARTELLHVFRAGFERASAARDAAATSRFFKLFPAIGWEAEGLEAYADFVVDLVKVRPPTNAKTSSPLYYVTVLTALFESIALVVDQHQPVVEKYYGVGKMASVITRLLQECDRVTKSLLEGWEEERGMKRKLVDTGAKSLNLRQQQGPPSAIDEEVVDPREIDKALTETAQMSGRWSLFRKFLFERLEEDEQENQADPPQKSEVNDKTPSAAPQLSLQFQAVEASACKQLFEDVLGAYYLPLEIWYTYTTIEKAHRLSALDTSTAYASTTAPDDVFYILKIVLQRVLSTGSAPAVAHATARLRDVLDVGHAGAIKRRLDDIYRGSGPGSAAAARGEKGERELRLAFIMSLNDLDVSSGHLERLVRDAQDSAALTQNFLTHELSGIRADIVSLLMLQSKFRATLRSGIEQLFNQLVRPKLRTFVPDVYRDVSYVLSEEEYAAAEYTDVVRKRFIRALDILLDGYKEAFTEPNFRLFFGALVDVLIRPWEKFVMGMRFNELGAVRFDRDLRAIVTHISSQTAFGDVRDKFARLQQISQLLNLDNEEDVADFYNGSGIPWKLSVQEAQAVGALRV